MMHDPETLASAYLDGELTDEERRAAEADPAVMAEVEQLRALRSGIADVEAPSDAARESAIGAAMAAFHDQFAAATPATTPGPVAESEPDVVVPLFRKLVTPQWLGVAAAAVVLVVGVGVVATRGGDDQDDSSFDVAASESDDSGDAADTAELPDATSERIAESEMADDVFAADAEESTESDMAMVAEEPAEEPADEPASDDMADTDMADAEAGDDMIEEPADEAADDGGLGVPPALDDPALHFDDDVPIVGPLQLRAAAWYLLAQRAEGALGPTPEYRCEFYNVLDTAVFDVDGEFVEILVEIDEVDRIVFAVDRDDCLVVATVDLDEP